MAHSEPLHPIEALLLLAIATGRALLTLTIHLIALALLLAGYRPSPRPWAHAPRPEVARLRPALLASLPVPQLRTVARRRLGSAARPGGRRIAQATRSALLEVLA